MSLDVAIAVAKRLRDALADEVERARHERELLKHLNHAGLFDRAAKRALFNTNAKNLQLELGSVLAEFATANALAEVTLASLRQIQPKLTAQLSQAFDEIRALAAALSELDELNLMLANRTLRCVRGYLGALRPKPTAYDRLGREPARDREQGSFSRRV